jgi:predicted DsbA family dithiol-disulfide isomerase
VNVDIWSDIACPWCYIGKRRFEEALARFPQADEVTVTWRSFELDPEAPAQRAGDPDEALAAKYGMTLEQAQDARAQLAATAADDGLEMHLDIQRQGNTFDAHRLIHLAAEHGLQDAMKGRLMRAYFVEGELVSDHETLIALGVDVGLDADEARTTLTGDRFADAVRADEATAQTLGISAVPTFIVDHSLGLSGAHPPAQLLQFLEQGLAQTQTPPDGQGGRRRVQLAPPRITPR